MCIKILEKKACNEYALDMIMKKEKKKTLYKTLNNTKLYLHE